MNRPHNPINDALLAKVIKETKTRGICLSGHTLHVPAFTKDRAIYDLTDSQYQLCEEQYQ